MSCGHCKAAIEAAVAAVDGDATVSVDLDARTVAVTSQSASSVLIAAMKAAGYDATVAA
jgi:copper chaperone